jgi:hypothetical protein
MIPSFANSFAMVLLIPFAAAMSLIVKLRVEAMNLVAQPKVEETVRQWLGWVNLDPDDSGDV